MNIKERFENYESKPDAAVWDGIARQARQRRALRRAAIASAVTATLALATWAFWPRQQEQTFVATAQTTAPIVMQEAQTTAPAAQADEARLVKEEKSETASTKQPLREESTCQASRTDNENVAVTVQPRVAAIQPVQAAPSISLAPAPVERREKATAAGQSAVEDEKAPVATPSVQKTQMDKRTEVTPETDLMVWMPNAFLPDNGESEQLRTFRAIAKDGAQISHFKMYVFNRAGAQVFHGTSIDQPWDGTYRGAKCPSGSYVYVIEYRDAVKGLQHIKGTVTLIR